MEQNQESWTVWELIQASLPFLCVLTVNWVAEDQQVEKTRLKAKVPTFGQSLQDYRAGQQYESKTLD